MVNLIDRYLGFVVVGIVMAVSWMHLQDTVEAGGPPFAASIMQFGVGLVLMLPLALASATHNTRKRFGYVKMLSWCLVVEIALDLTVAFSWGTFVCGWILAALNIAVGWPGKKEE